MTKPASAKLAGRSRRPTGVAGGWFQHPHALVETDRIGPGTRVWAFAHVLPGAVIGADCNICDHVFVENDVVVGDRVTVKCGVQLWDGLTLEEDVFVGPNVTFTNDRFPRSRVRPPAFLRTVVKAGASIGANATILPGVTIGKKAMVGAGALVRSDVPPQAIVVGNPAYISGYVDSGRPDAPFVEPCRGPGQPWPVRVKGVSVHEVKLASDMRGSLAVAELGAGLPFAPKRFFTVFDVPSRQVRGEHAHLTLHQFLVCLRGECSLVVDDGESREEILLDTPRIGVHLRPMVWGIQYRFSPDAILLVLASEAYEPEEYIRDYDAFQRRLRSAVRG